MVEELERVGTTDVTLVTIYGVAFFNSKGDMLLEWYLSWSEAMSYCDGDVEPIIVETFEGSNIHLAALNA